MRTTTRWNSGGPSGSAVTGRRCRGGFPRAIPDDRFNELFAALSSNRDRALVAFWISTGVRASELLGVRSCDVVSGRAADQRGAQGLPRRAAGAGVGGRVRVAAALSAGPVRAGHPAWSPAAAVVDAAPAVSAADLSRARTACSSGSTPRSAPIGRCMTCDTAPRRGWRTIRS